MNSFRELLQEAAEKPTGNGKFGIYVGTKNDKVELTLYHMDGKSFDGDVKSFAKDLKKEFSYFTDSRIEVESVNNNIIVFTGPTSYQLSRSYWWNPAWKKSVAEQSTEQRKFYHPDGWQKLDKTIEVIAKAFMVYKD